MLPRVMPGLALICLLAALVPSGPARASEPDTAAKEIWSDLPLPKVGVRLEDHAPFSGRGIATYVWIQIPQIPLQWGRGVHNAFDVHYEQPYGLVLLDSQTRDDGVFEMRHRWSRQPQVILVSELTRGPGKVHFEVRAERDPEAAADKVLPEELPYLNLCLSLKRARGCFDFFPDTFPEFIGRCFIYTDKGRTFLDTIPRGKISDHYGASDDDPRNNPPWIARYHEERFTVPIVGVVSRDRQHLIAIGSDTSRSVAQAWAPCIHNTPEWEPKDAPPGQQRWNMTVYIMPNDPDALLQRFAMDTAKEEVQ